MVFKRQKNQAPDLPQKDLTLAMNGIGMLFSGNADPNADIEETLVAASRVVMGDFDFRVGSVLVTWLGLHLTWTNADKLIKMIKEEKNPRVLAFWNAIGQWQKKDHRFKRLHTIYSGPRINLTPVGSESLVAMRGEDPRFAETVLCAPQGTLRDRNADVLSPSELAQKHLVYQCRLLIGPSYRADALAAIKTGTCRSISDIARKAHTSFSTAWELKRDLDILASNGPTITPAHVSR